MVSMHVETGAQEIRRCEACQVSVLHFEWKSIENGGTFLSWTAVEHTKADGSPCAGAVGTKTKVP